MHHILLLKFLLLHRLLRLSLQFRCRDVVAEGRFGPYVRFKEAFVSIPNGEEIGSVDLARAIELIELKREADAPIAHYDGHPVQKGTGRFGPFIKWNDLFINVNKKYDFDNLSEANIEELIEIKKQKEIDNDIKQLFQKASSLVHTTNRYVKRRGRLLIPM